MLTGVLQVGALPPQCTFWRFLTSLPLTVAQQVFELQRLLRERVWEAANVQLPAITLDTDTGDSLRPADGGAHDNPKNKRKRATADSHLYRRDPGILGGELRNGDRPADAQIARHLEAVFAAVPRCVNKIYARADSGFYCGEAVAAYEKGKASFIIVARKTPRLLEELETAHWRPSPKTDADEQCEFDYQPEGTAKAYRFIALRYQKKDEAPKSSISCGRPRSTSIELFVTDMKDAIHHLVWFYNQRAGAENLIKEANNDAG